jgi:hypothetical protein
MCALGGMLCLFFWAWQPFLPRSNTCAAICAKHPPRQHARTRLLATPAILRTLKSQWGAHASEVVLWAARCVSFIGFCGSGSLPAGQRRTSTPQWPYITVT